MGDIIKVYRDSLVVLVGNTLHTDLEPFITRRVYILVSRRAIKFVDAILLLRLVVLHQDNLL